MPFLHFAVNVGVALLLGVAIGLERQWRQHPAGLRTNALVCVGAALFVSLSHLLTASGEKGPRESVDSPCLGMSRRPLSVP